MLSFRQKRCNAFCWDGVGQFYGLRLERSGDGARVLKVWAAARQTGRGSDAELLAAGQAALGFDEETAVVLGGELGKACLTELELPPLSAADRQRALRHELARRVPAPLTGLTWGCRRLPAGPAGGPRRWRVALVPSATYQAWLEAASGLPGGVDLIIPPGAALDPLLAGRQVCLTERPGAPAFSHEPAPGGGRDLGFAPSKAGANGAYGLGEQPLQVGGVELGELAGLPPADQAAFAAPLLLALYGVSRELQPDRAAWLPLPLEMRPHRNRWQKLWLLSAAAVLLLAAMLGGGRWLYAQQQDRSAARAHEQALRRAIAARRAEASHAPAIGPLRDDLRKLLTSRRAMFETLAGLTTALGPQLYAQRYEWRDGAVTLQLRAAKDEPDLTAALRRAPWVRDYREGKSVNPNDQTVTYTVNLRVGAEAGGELEVVPLPPGPHVLGPEGVPVPLPPEPPVITPGDDAPPPEDIPIPPPVIEEPEVPPPPPAPDPPPAPEPPAPELPPAP